MQLVFKEHADRSAALAESLYEHDCCGDLIVAKVIYNTPDVTLRSPAPWSYHHFNKQPPHKTKFNGENLCAPLLSFHHLSDEVPAIRKFELKYSAWRRPYGRYITYADAFEHFAPSFLLEATSRSENRLFLPGWNNYAYSLRQLVAVSAWDCEQACIDEADCLIWKWRGYDFKCFLDSSMRMGKQVGRTDVVSGWRLDRWAKLFKKECA